jgi:hypothetical protein
MPLRVVFTVSMSGSGGACWARALFGFTFYSIFGLEMQKPTQTICVSCGISGTHVCGPRHLHYRIDYPKCDSLVAFQEAPPPPESRVQSPILSPWCPDSSTTPRVPVVTLRSSSSFTYSTLSAFRSACSTDLN